MALSPQERTLRASLAVHTMWSKTVDRTARTQPARDAFRKSFEKKVDPDSKLDLATRSKMAENAYQAHFKKMALARSKKARGAAA